MSHLTFSSALAMALLLTIGSATAADRSAERHEVSTAALDDLGLAGLQPIGDRQGRTIRGRAFIGTPGTGPFTTLPANALGKGDLGVIEHGFLKGTQTTTIVNHPQFGTITLPPQLQK